MKELTVRCLGSLLICDGEWERAGAESVHIFEQLDTDLPATAEPYCVGSGTIRFYDAAGHSAGRVYHCQMTGHLVLLDDGRWYEVTSAQAVHRDGQWCMRYRGAKNTELARMLNARPIELLRFGRRTRRHVGGRNGR